VNDEIILEIKNLKTYFYTYEGVAKAVDGVSYQLAKGEPLGVVGESGCGKSVTALSILRLIPTPPGRIVGGEILFNGKNLLGFAENEMRKIRGNRISMIFQEPMTSLNPVFTVGGLLVKHLNFHKPSFFAKQARPREFESNASYDRPLP
jgi:ABC-type dipeptide/oligopeptide/nickel transport system ATPase component